MSYIPLIEHTHPRILMIDFAPHDVAKIQKAGFEARRGATGLHDRKEFCIPYATQDVEVMFVQVQNNSFTSKDLTASKESVEEKPFFKDLTRETWEKAGWVVFFISQDTSPEELSAIGIEKIGVISWERQHLPESLREPLLDALESKRQGQKELIEVAPPQMPRFRGEAVRRSKEPELDVLQRYIKSARMSVLTCLSNPLSNKSAYGYSHSRIPSYSPYTPQPHVIIFGQVETIQLLILDNSADENVLALKIHKSIYGRDDGKQSVYNVGGILLLPDFGNNNGNVALALLQEVFTQTSPHIFDTPLHPWLEKYQPAPILHLLAERTSVVEKAIQRLNQLDEQIEAERENYAWLSGLLVSTGDEFAVYVAQALRFLGFEVEEVDNNLVPSERRREDYRILDRITGYFAIGEAKTTGKGRGASEDFITKTQTHQALYAREKQQVPPPALLIANYAINLDPAQRASRFYLQEVEGRLKDNAITALNSVALFELCQFVLDEQLSKEEARQFISRGQPLINSVTVEGAKTENDSPNS